MRDKEEINLPTKSTLNNKGSDFIGSFVFKPNKNLKFDYNFSMDGVESRITISGGMSEYPTHTKKMKELIEYADQAMYKTKQNGGNNITIHDTF